MYATPRDTSRDKGQGRHRGAYMRDSHGARGGTGRADGPEVRKGKEEINDQHVPLT
jgi:hypothetical protein